MKSIRRYSNSRNQPPPSLCSNKIITKMINTFIFMDLETTGLIKGSLMPKITEISLIAASRSGICNATNALPRVLQKLVLAVNPEKPIPRVVQNMTGLSNDHLDKVECFNSDVFDLIIKFLKRQTAPVCFVAYNGNRFDYPILLSELKTIGQTFSEDILSIDMMYIVKDFCSRKTRLELDYNNLLNDGVTVASSNDVNNSPGTSYAKRMQAINEKTPESQILKSHNNNVQNWKANTVRRQLNFICPPSDFKLGTVLKYICGFEPENAHSAEGDCLSMIHCAIAMKDFAQEADLKAVPLINFTKA
ncbi:three prime repair exonuclease 2 isoform X3 [Ceratina calcarata]|uniref:Three prime repair exonuclease 2 isoform X3 n=1 Tax=Ceratina calcarata TaxID=156304 RepID=A0AAJ7J5C6_9HYME|nr:three prime repair exonuclease 2 isoform X3 [Ceratina calcarata]